MTAKAHLVAVGGPSDGHEYTLAPAEITLGRHPDSTVVVGWDGSVSRSHARITCLSGLFWLEDLGSKRGTFLILADKEERRLPPHEPSLLLDGASIRLGWHARFQVSGVVASQDESVRVLLAQLHQALSELYAGLAHLPAEDQERQLDQLRNLEARLRAAQDEAEFLRLVAEGVPTLTIMGEGKCPAEPPSLGQQAALPPLPNSLPDPEDPDRLGTIRNVFIGDIRARLPEAGDKGENTGD